MRGSTQSLRGSVVNRFLGSKSVSEPGCTSRFPRTIAGITTPTIETGTRLGAYEILATIGAGGMGEVYRARDTRLGREVAIKILPSQVASDERRMARFEREARLASSLNHPHVITIHDIGRQGDIAYIVMELVQGKTLRAAKRRSMNVLGIATAISSPKTS